MTLGYDPPTRSPTMSGGTSGDLTIAYYSVGWQGQLNSMRNSTTDFTHDPLGLM